MTPRIRPIYALAAVIAAVVFVFVLAVVMLAGGGGDDEGGSAGTGTLTDPRDVPTATPWQQPPEIVLIDPNNIQPLPPIGDQTGGGETPEGEGGASPAPSADCGEVYVVESGDTPSGIAEKCGISTQELLDANPGLDPTGLHAGDSLNIPKPSQ